MNALDEYLKFPAPTKNIRTLYVPKVTQTNEKGWSKIHVDVMRCDGITEDGTENLTKVAEYDRNYSLLKTFEPFQQLQDGVWRHYALISTRYTRVEVLDLQNGEIIAVESYPKATKEIADLPNSRYKEGQEMAGEGFCPMEFYIPDWWDEYDESYLPVLDGETGRMKSPFSSDSNTLEFFEEFSSYTGQWALYGGCIWGDDSSAKLRHIDLSRISEGIVSTDERFGYVQLPNDVHIKDAVTVNAEGGYIEVHTPILFRMDTGKALGKDFIMRSINWEEN